MSEEKKPATKKGKRKYTKKGPVDNTITDDEYLKEFTKQTEKLMSAHLEKPVFPDVRDITGEDIDLAVPARSARYKNIKTLTVPKEEMWGHVQTLQRKLGIDVPIDIHKSLGGDPSKVTIKVYAERSQDPEDDYVVEQVIEPVEPKPVEEISLYERIRQLVPRESPKNIRRAIEVHNRGGTVGVSTTKGLVVISALDPHRGGIERLRRTPNVVLILAEVANN